MKLQMGDVEVTLTLPLRFQSQLAQVGGASVVNLLQRACAALEGNESVSTLVEALSTAAYERSWEKLHCGSWKSVESVWRESFGYSSVLQKPRLELPHEILRDEVVAPQLDFPIRRLEMPTLEEFRRDVMLNNAPVIITGAMEFWPALGREAGLDRAWKDLRYLRRVAGWRTVPVEVGSSYLGDDWGQELMTVNEFLDRHIIPPLLTKENTDPATETGQPEDGEKLGYLAQHRLFDQIPVLGRDIITPDYCTVQRIEDGEEEDEDITVNGWFGPGRTVSPLHFDPKDNVLCQIVGAKYLRLYAPEESSKLYPVEGLLSNTSQVQVENPDDVQFPNFCRAKYVDYQMKKGEPQNVYKSVTLAGPVACVTMGTSKGTEDKAFVATGQHVHGFSKKGKEFFKFQSNLAEPLRKIHVYDNQLWTATDFTFNQYENGADKHSFVSPDRINDVLVVPVNHEQDFYGVLGCQDRYVRVVKDSNAVAKKAMAAPITALCRVPTVTTKGTQSSGPAQVIYGTAAGGLGLITYNGDKLKNKWKTTLASGANSKNAGTHGDNGLSTSSATINSIVCFDINRDDHPEILVGRDDGRVEVYSFNSTSGDVVKLFEHANSDSIRCVQGGIVTTPGYEELVACTFSGRVLSFTTEPLDQPDDDDTYGRSRGTVQRETRIVKLRKEVTALEDKIARMSLQRGAKEKEYLPVAEDLVVNSKFQLNAALGAYDVSLEIPVSIQMIVLHSAVPLDLLENESNLAIVSKSPVDPTNGTHFLATYRCLEPTHRLEFQVRTIEGQFGHVEATVVANTQPRSAQTVKFFVKPLSLHHRVNELSEAEEAEFQKPCNTLQLSGDFSLVQIHDWVSMCLPEVPGRLQSDEVTLRYRNTFVGSLLVCRYSKGEASFSTPSVSAIAILKEIITKEATARKATLNISLDIKKESVPVMLGYLRPLLDAKHALSSQVKLIDGLKELQLHEDDYSAWMAPEYQNILENSEKILAEFKLSPKALNYLAGILTDLYVDLCKFRGTSAKQNLPRLYQLIDHYHFDSLVEFYLRD
ncbi:hypothetical protein JM18_004329 [Phytophthora kernoviae]|uniref:Cupin-like domain-containing protein n=1 Tax=Phytophthora kernoviae TaxID=325452 RepID=A0A921V9P4_9STRA|nr:hypothetical protein JM18_004329 [Phytophthora kernoviae]